MISGVTSRRKFSDLSEQEILALAISSEEDDARIYRSYAEMLRENYPGSARIFDGMADAEDDHRRSLIKLHEARFGSVIPLIRREHVAGYYARRPGLADGNAGIERHPGRGRGDGKQAESSTGCAARRTTDAIRVSCWETLPPPKRASYPCRGGAVGQHLDDDSRSAEDRDPRSAIRADLGSARAGGADGWIGLDAWRRSLPPRSPPGYLEHLSGDGSFSVGAGISMGFTEAASDDGEHLGAGVAAETRPCLGA